jgi:hypothetical protein
MTMNYEDLPKTRAEAKATGAKYYFTGEPCKHGHVAPRKTKGACLECIKLEWQENNTKRAEYFKEYNKSEKGQENKRRYYEANKEQVMARAAARPAEEKRRHKKKYHDENPEQRKATTSIRRRRFRNATPSWLTKEQKNAMKQLYIEAQRLTKITGERYVVDHIVPLINEEVCGLHVPWNLRVITQDENLVKSNKLIS